MNGDRDRDAARLLADDASVVIDYSRPLHASSVRTFACCDYPCHDMRLWHCERAGRTDHFRSCRACRACRRAYGACARSDTTGSGARADDNTNTNTNTNTHTFGHRPNRPDHEAHRAST
jgi:hypothetical protein